MRVLFISLTACFLVAGCLIFPMYVPDPYSDTLAGYLNQPRLERVGVQRWLGPPATTRVDGKYEVYLAHRETQWEYFQTFYDFYFLLIEYDDRGRLVRHDKIVNRGCTGQMLCIKSVTWLNSFERPSLVETKNALIRYLVLYATPETDQQAKDSLTSPEGCRHFIYRSNKIKNLDSPPPVVMLVDPESGGTFSLPADGYMVFAGECAARQISVAWADAWGNFEEQALHLGGVVPGSMVTRLDPKLVKFWGARYSLTAAGVSPDKATNEIRSRRLVLR